MRTISDFIMEQETSVESYAGGSNEDIIKCYTEMAALTALVECYVEHATIMEYCDDCGISNPSIFTESDSKDSLLSRAGNTIKHWASSVWEMLTAVVKGIVRTVTGVNYKNISEALAKYEPDAEFTFDTRKIKSAYCAGKLIDIINDFKELLKDDAKFTASDINKKNGSFQNIKDRLEKVRDTVKMIEDNKGTGMNVTVQETRDILDELERADIPSSGKKLLKEIEFNKKNITKSKKDDSVDKESVKAIKSLANDLVKTFDKWHTEFLDTMHEILKIAKKEEKLGKRAMKTGGAMSDFATEGYYFV
jgi:hypothetical protein